jgi:uncharacterized membrane protein
VPTLGPLEIIIVLVIFAMFVAVAYVLVIGLARLVHRDDTTKRDPAIDALRTRFANGDIDQAEFERLRSVLHRG